MLAVKKLREDAYIPTKGSKYAAGWDLYSVESHIIAPHATQIVKTGIAVAIPIGTYLRIAPRSGLAAKNGIDVLAGVVDYDYRGEIMVILVNHSDKEMIITPGLRIAQAILEKIHMCSAIEVDDLEDTERGAKGFGSTGS